MVDFGTWTTMFITGIALFGLFFVGYLTGRLDERRIRKMVQAKKEG